MILEGEDIVLRPADEAECKAAGFADGAEAVRASVRASKESYRVCFEGAVVAYWGYIPMSVLGGGCTVWMLSTPAADACPVFMARQSRAMRDWLLDNYGDVYTTAVHRDHTVSLRWLRWLGFHEYECDTSWVRLRATRKGLMQ